MKFKILGTKIYVSFLFLAPLCLMLLLDKSGFFLPMVIAVILHETAHLTAMWMLHCNPKEISLIPASVRIVRSVTVRVRNEIIISLSGPLINILFFSVFFAVFKTTGNMDILNFSLINLLFAVFNLLPVKQLDGGLILYKLLSYFKGENKAQIVLNFISAVTGVLLLVLGIWLFLKNKNFSVIVMSLYILLSILVKL
ncbi:MAG: site-2 protease family protein [Clostridia bacterium]|nr:site-2 protease family protein [Clostridia bacterium]